MIPFPFNAPSIPLSERSHGPCGYKRYQSYKVWLRDEHAFRCVYCLARERWALTGADVFGVDHIKSKSNSKHLSTLYENLCYCCNFCNSRKLKVDLPDELENSPLDQHIKVLPDGKVQTLSDEGCFLSDLLLLQNEGRTEVRQLILELHKDALQQANQGLRTLKTQIFSYPKSLPDLANTRAPGGNDRPNGVKASALALQTRGRLPDFY